MKKVFIFLLLSLFTVSCGPHYVDYFPYHDDGAPKPHVVFLPVIDNIKSKQTCNLSEEMTRTICFEMMNTGELFLLSPQEVQAGLASVGKADLFDCDQAFAQQFCESDFVAIVELIEQEFAPCVKEELSQMKLSARLKIIDLRSRTPRIVTQEILNENYLVCVASQISAKPDPFHVTTVGKAFRAFATTLSVRIENLILSSY